MGPTFPEVDRVHEDMGSFSIPIRLSCCKVLIHLSTQ